MDQYRWTGGEPNCRNLSSFHLVEGEYEGTLLKYAQPKIIWVVIDHASHRNL